MRAILLFALAMLLSAQAWALQADVLVTAAREQVGVTLTYDPAYRRLGYPNGDVPLNTGVCTDVVIRALREQGLDLQQAVHQDMRANFRLYPKNWGLSRPDSNIDHRRVPNLMTWFKRQGWALQVGEDAARYPPGAIVAWDLGGGRTHIGVSSDRQAGSGVPLVLHNIGRGTQEEDILFRFKITGQYRIPEA